MYNILYIGIDNIFFTVITFKFTTTFRWKYTCKWWCPLLFIYFFKVSRNKLHLWNDKPC